MQTPRTSSSHNDSESNNSFESEEYYSALNSPNQITIFKRESCRGGLSDLLSNLEIQTGSQAENSPESPSDEHASETINKMPSSSQKGNFQFDLSSPSYHCNHSAGNSIDSSKLLSILQNKDNNTFLLDTPRDNEAQKQLKRMKTKVQVKQEVSFYIKQQSEAKSATLPTIPAMTRRPLFI